MPPEDVLVEDVRRLIRVGGGVDGWRPSSSSSRSARMSEPHSGLRPGQRRPINRHPPALGMCLADSRSADRRRRRHATPAPMSLPRSYDSGNWGTTAMWQTCCT